MTGGRNVTPEQQRRVRARIEACVPVATTPKTCPRTAEARHAAGPVTDLSPAELAASIRETLRATMGTDPVVRRLVCTTGGTCDARFGIAHGRYPVAMRYRVRALRSAVGRCWVLISWQVKRPARLPARSCPC